MRLEEPREIQRVAKAHGAGDLRNAHRALLQKLCGAIEAQGADILRDPYLHLPLEQGGDVFFVVRKIRADAVTAKRRVAKMLVNILLDK